MIKVDRTFPAPKSLETEAKKKNGSYTEKDVVDQLLRDFRKKCYICEINDLQDPQVEHLLPHKNGKYPERKFDWNNLFLSCGHCNSVKNQKKYDEGIIDCCKVDPEKLLTFKINENAVEIEKKKRKIKHLTEQSSYCRKYMELTIPGCESIKATCALKEYCAR